MPKATISPTMRLAYHYVRGMEKRGEIYPGTTDLVIGEFARKGNPGQTLRAAVEYMDGKGAARLRNPEFESPKEMPLRAVINRLVAGGAVKEESAEELVQAWALESSGFSLGLLAERVGQRFEDPKNEKHLVTAMRPDVPLSLVKVTSVLERFRSTGQLGTRIDIHTIAKDLDGRFRAGQGEYFEVARKVADLIKAQPLLQPEGGVKFDMLDSIFHPDGQVPAPVKPATPRV